MSACKHEKFFVETVVNRLLDEENNIIQYVVDLKVSCDDCKIPFAFLGLPAGLKLNGAAVSADGLEARLAVVPRDEILPTVGKDAVQGFLIRRRV